jgi:hypothetical protein
VFSALACSAQSQLQSSSNHEISLRKFLQKYAGNSDEKQKTRYSYAFVDLKDNGAREVIVYLTGDGWCGTGGVTTLVLAPEGASYNLITKITVTRPPIRVLSTRSNGWHDISVMARSSSRGEG